MAKGIKIALISVVVIILVGFLILTLALDSIVKSNIEQIGTEMTGTWVTVDNVSISPFTGAGTITGVRIGNPEGYGTENAIVIDEIVMRAKIRSVFSDVIIIEDINVYAPTVYVEQKLPDNNLATILNNIHQAAERGTSSDANMVVNHFVMHDGSVDLYTEVGGERSVRFDLADIELHDIGGNGESTAVEQVVRQIADRVFQQALQAAVREGADQLRDAIEDLFN